MNTKPTAEQQELVTERVAELKLNNAGFFRCNKCGVPMRVTDKAKWCIVGYCPNTELRRNPEPDTKET